jgi:hypothetical protein
VKLAAHEWAYQELENLTEQFPTTKKGGKLFYFKLTRIIKEYLLRRYKWKVLDKTDDELISFLRTKQFSPRLLEDVKVLLRGIVEIKFADAQSMKEQLKRDVAIARNVVEKTADYLIEK